MFNAFEDFQKFGKDGMDNAMKAFGAQQKSFQAIATEVADFSKKSIEQSSSVFERMLGVKSLDKAIEVQTDYMKNAYEGFVAHANKLGELYTDFAKESFKPFEAMTNRADLAR